MKVTGLFLVFMILVLESAGQLVRRKDFDAAFALQVGGEIGVVTAFHQPQVALRPTGGLKMTFPFNRKWFLGGEVNYSELRYKISQQKQIEEEGLSLEQQAALHLKQCRVPLYVKYMLNNNKASILLGIYGAYVLDSKLNTALKQQKGKTEVDHSDMLDKWHAGITLGYEHRLFKHMHIMCQLNVGLKEVVKQQSVFEDKWLPLQAGVTLSYDVFRIGDCGCD